MDSCDTSAVGSWYSDGSKVNWKGDRFLASSTCSSANSSRSPSPAVKRSLGSEASEASTAATNEGCGSNGSQQCSDSCQCNLCGTLLGKRRLNPRHHCRICKAVVCGSCSQSRITLEGARGSQRVCTSCITNAYKEYCRDMNGKPEQPTTACNSGCTATSECHWCGEALGLRFLRPRHYCRICDKAVCSTCSPSFVKLEGDKTLQRACLSCAANLKAVAYRENKSGKSPTKPKGSRRARSASPCLTGGRRTRSASPKHDQALQKVLEAKLQKLKMAQERTAPKDSGLEANEEQHECSISPLKDESMFERSLSEPLLDTSSMGTHAFRRSYMPTPLDFFAKPRDQMALQESLLRAHLTAAHLNFDDSQAKELGAAKTITTEGIFLEPVSFSALKPFRKPSLGA